MDKKDYFKIYTDGGARGNPGPAAYGWLLFTSTGELTTFDSKYMGIATNNIAEYTGLLSALKYAAKNKQTLGIDKIECYLDSELVVKQVKGEYEVKNQDLKKLFLDIRDLINQFSEVKFIHIERALNKHADKLVNITLDAQNQT